jgi:hypothetical protein
LLARAPSCKLCWALVSLLTVSCRPACCYIHRCARCRGGSSGLRQQRSLGPGCSSRTTWRCHQLALRWCRCVPCAAIWFTSLPACSSCIMRFAIEDRYSPAALCLGHAWRASPSLLLLFLPAARVPSQGAPQHALCCGHSSHAQAARPRQRHRLSCPGACAADCSAGRHWRDRCAAGLPVLGLSAPSAAVRSSPTCAQQELLVSHMASQLVRCAWVLLQAPASQALSCSGRVLLCLRPSAHSQSLWRTCLGAGRRCQTCHGTQVSC